jgi:hypothetical protein
MLTAHFGLETAFVNDVIAERLLAIISDLNVAISMLFSNEFHERDILEFCYPSSSTGCSFFRNDKLLSYVEMRLRFL